jgi:hypothetical protein
MRCDEIREQLVDLLYQEQGAPEPGLELQEHVRSCASCQKDLAELKGAQAALKLWQDEPPLRPVVLPRAQAAKVHLRVPFWRVVRYAAIAALVVFAFLGLSNAQIQWDQNGFAFRTSLFARAPQASNYYTKDDMQTILDRVERHIQKDNFQMMQGMLDMIDQERADEYRIITRQIKESRNKN